ncbi:TPA: GNAT family N-acetyltransferase [Streptococcus equi subsp. zooepidemicus]|uniref:GNAT family N-acetyltransferase n=1 Tax=Streptococcus equi TaxID=1336 RepID=UPI0024AD65F5|nr:GNAT family N-acetyltransferase [Streptococcus equi]MDI5915393.1 GNAT family N-acetyltransferase [Streptococcus equi subsp. zooepidemicus]HEL0022334.1 GNAT family N-acetyltransferase [Streptococcus equi subsp. zooepidemicus]HEL0040266.1 GNAT family N-acetyltransferase [Streptococcus equi subsp. zooepidemicus]HEL0042248.1 GNAT family N-acetyltransferase [Streptococcus equi subsp. zooepidemicus]HEL0044247.1 GNAT family N-acetyltransferase [Streptococcus equi subsp. zooepidemicus]
MIRVIVGNQPFQRAAGLYIRYQVFVLERQIDRQDEFDDFDSDDRLYAVLYDGDQPVSTARFLPTATDQARLTRVATLSQYRGKGYAAQVIEALEQYAREQAYKRLVIHSEISAQSFYEGLGYQAFGEPYDEDGEPCQSVEKYL